MTTSIKTNCGEVQFSNGINDYFYEAFRNAPDLDACLSAVRDFVEEYVDRHLPDNLTWHPHLSEVYVDLDAEMDPDEVDDREVDDVLWDLVNDGMAEADYRLEQDPDYFGRSTPLTEYEELLAAAFADDATQDDINALGEWFEANGLRYWNGEDYNIDGYHSIRPVYEWDEETDTGEIVRYEIR